MSTSGAKGSVKEIDRGTVHRICSGQVVLSLAVAVKELVENSLDAEASVVEVRLREHGADLVEVVDNGSGLTEDNFQALTLKHHTSKISNFSDLEVGVSTFGFRGEALSSLCALSDLSVTTCHVTSKVGTRLEYDSHGLIKMRTHCARQVGTTVSLRKLFHSLPVRRKEFTRNIKREFVRMVQLLQGYCIVSTGVKITCHNQTGKGGKQLVLSTTGGSTLKENITEVFGAKQFSQLIEIVQCSREDIENAEGDKVNHTDLFKLTGYVSRCNHGYGRGSTDRQFFFFNNRPCDHPKLTKLVNEVYHYYNRHQYPFIVLNITTDREHVDVNVTPDKRKVMLHQEKALLILVKVTLKKLFEPMQGLYDTSGHTPSPSYSADSSFSSAKSTPSLKRFLPEKVTLKDQPHTKQAKLFDYSMTRHSPELNTSLQCESEAPLPPSGTKSGSHNEHTDESGSHIEQPNSVTNSAERTDGVSEDHFEATNVGLSPRREGGKNESITCSGCLTDCKEDVIDIPVLYVGATNSDMSMVNSSSENNVNDTSQSPNDIHVVDDCEQAMFGNGVFLEAKAEQTNQQKNANYTHSGQSAMTITHQYRPLAKRTHPNKVKGSSHGSQNSELATHKDEPVSQSVLCDLEAIARRQETKRQLLNERDGSGGKSFRAKISPASNKEAENELRREISKSDFSNMQILGQFNLGFIITKLGSDLFIVDQHASDEKYNFERLQRETVIKHQNLISPLPLELTAVHEGVLMDNLEVFQMNGFHFQIDHSAPPCKRIKLTSKPVCSGQWSLGPKDIDELVFLLSDGGVSQGEVVRPSAVRAYFASKACRTSVMIGTSLSKYEMKKLVCHLGQMEQPWNCPHGRPTMRHLFDLSRL